MLFRSHDLVSEFERLTKNLQLGPEFEKAMDDLSQTFAGGSNVDAVRTAEAFEIYIDLPGVDPSTVDVTVEGRSVTVAANREFAVDESAELVHRGRRHGAFSRTFRLAEDLDIDNLSARSDHGVLIVSVPVTAGAAARKISVISSES